MDLNWDAIGAIAEAGGATGVIVTLIYLIKQIQQNTAASRSAAAAAYSEASMSLAGALAESAEASRLFYTYLDEPKSLGKDEERRAEALVSMYIHTMEQSCDLYLEGTLTEEKWNARYRQLVWIATRPGFTHYWEVFGDVYPLSLGGYVKKAMAENG